MPRRRHMKASTIALPRPPWTTVWQFSNSHFLAQREGLMSHVRMNTVNIISIQSGGGGGAQRWSWQCVENTFSRSNASNNTGRKQRGHAGRGGRRSEGG